MRIVRPFVALAVCLLLVLPALAHAACTSPAGDAGMLQYNSERTQLEYCNGAQWIGFPKGGQCSAAGTWTVVTGPSTNQWRGIAYGNGKFVAVANSGTNRVATSPNGITWTASGAVAANTWYDVAFGEGKFVMVADSGASARSMYSTNDGQTWTAGTLPATRTWRGVAYGNGMFVAVANDGVANPVMYSADGITWTLGTAPNSVWNRVTFGNGRFVAVGNSGTAMYSTNGTTWTAATGMAAGTWADVTYGDGKFVAVGTGTNKIAYSSDGNTWTSVALPAGAATEGYEGIAYGNILFLAVTSYSSGAQSIYSNDGITWYTQAIPSDRDWSKVTFGEGNFVAVGTANDFAYSMCAGLTYVQKRVFLTSGSSWTVPDDWNSASNTIEAIGGGGGGGGGGATGGGRGGGGGAYNRITNLALTPGATVNIQIGAGGAGNTGTGAGGTGGDTYFNGTGTTCAAQSLCAKGGAGGGGNASGTGGTGGASGSGVPNTGGFSGGNSGTTAATTLFGSGGGGAGGPGGVGGNGGNFSVNSTSATGGSGGGGNGGGGNGVNNANNSSGTAGGTSVGGASGGGGGVPGSPGANGTAGSNGSGGGGGGATAGDGGTGGAGIEWTSNFGSGGGGGGGGSGNGGLGAIGGYYGGGGGGGGSSGGDGAAGREGILVITYNAPIVQGSSGGGGGVLTRVALTTVGANTYSVPADWTATGSAIHLIGGGGAGEDIEGGGGGGGGYAKFTNVSLPPGGTITYNVGAGGTASSGNGGNSWICSSTANCTSAIDSGVVGSAFGGAGSTSNIGGTGGAGSPGTGAVEYNGGNGGNANVTWDSGGGGGGAAGPNGNGANGGVGEPDGDRGGGGGGANGGGAGQSGDSGTGGTNRFGTGAGTGSGSSGNPGSNGGGGGGGGDSGGAGGNGTEWSASHGAGGGGGGSGGVPPGTGGLYGGGGGGSGTGAGAAGRQGLIILEYYVGGETSSICEGTDLGHIMYNGDDRVLQWCDGAAWRPAGPIDPGGANGNCSSPSQPGGYVLFSSSTCQIQYCDGATWRGVGAPYTLGDNLAGYWMFNESSGTTAADRTTNGNNGTVTSGTWAPAGGRNAGALEFNGTTTVVNAGSAATLDNLGPQSVSVWIYPRTHGENNNAWIVGKGTGANLPTNGWLLGLTNSVTRAVRFAVHHNTSHLEYVTATNAITFNQWNHILVTWNGTTGANSVDIKVNGVSQAFSFVDAGSGARLNDAAETLYIGNNSAGSRTFDGFIDDLRVYSRSLSAAEIGQLYEDTGGMACK